MKIRGSEGPGLMKPTRQHHLQKARMKSCSSETANTVPSMETKFLLRSHSDSQTALSRGPSTPYSQSKAGVFLFIFPRQPPETLSISTLWIFEWCLWFWKRSSESSHSFKRHEGSLNNSQKRALRHEVGAAACQSPHVCVFSFKIIHWKRSLKNPLNKFVRLRK